MCLYHVYAAVADFVDCRIRDRHNWLMTLDEQDIFRKPSRHCIFTCSRCGKTREERRWALSWRAGAIVHFFGEDWPLTFTPRQSDPTPRQDCFMFRYMSRQQLLDEENASSTSDIRIPTLEVTAP